MTPSERANLPVFHAAARPSYEIWFVVVFDPRHRRALWLRYTTYRGVGGDRAMLWAAVFAPGGPFAVKAIEDHAAFDPGRRDAFEIGIGAARLGHGFCRGGIAGRVRWDLSFEPSVAPVPMSPPWLSRLPLPVHAEHVHHAVPFRGVVEVDDERWDIEQGTGLQTHIHGTRRVAELSWVYCSAFEQDRSASLEAMHVRPRLHLPGLTSVRAETRHRLIDRTDFPYVLINKLHSPRPGIIELRTRRASIRARVECPVEHLIGYVYRDPAGHDLYVAQCDIADCTMHIGSTELTAPNAAALEHHGPNPLPGVHYIPWDDRE